jgi:hypothetical protein
MLVKCINSFRQQISEGDVYIVIEVLVKRTKNIISYRVIDNEGFPAIYDSKNFEIISNNIDDFAISVCQDKIVLSHKLILNSEVNEKNVEGFWGLFIEDDIETREILKNVVCSMANIEGIESPKIL